MIKRILELLDYIKSDIDPKGLDYVFPEVKHVFYLDTNGDTDFMYTRLDTGVFEVTKSLWNRNDKDFASVLTEEDMLDTIKQSFDQYELRIQKIKNGYDLILVEI